MSYPTHPFQPSPSAQKHIPSITLGRFGQFTGGHYASVNLSSALYLDEDGSKEAVKLESWSPKAGSSPTFAEASRARYKPAQVGDQFGPSWSNHWFRVSLTVPRKWADYERVQFEFDPDCEGLIFTPEGVPVHALVGGGSGLRRVEYVLEGEARKPGHTHHFYIEISCNGMFGVPQGGAEIEPPDPDRFFTLAKASLVAPNVPAHSLLQSFTILKQVAEEATDSPLGQRALHTANAIVNAFVPGDASSITACLGLAKTVLGDWEAEPKASAADAGIFALGHCHIDSAWLWPFASTKKKVARSWSSQVYLMDHFAEHRFSATSAAQYKWLQDLYPLLFDKVKAKVDAGQFGIIGGTWVEMDTNLPSGESLVRQFLYGQRFFESRFGARCKTFVLPDTFGYSSQLPQIARSAGCDYFFTQKLSWNNINKFPHTSFNWSGLDGTQVLTHMTPVDTYNAQCDFGELKKGAEGNKNLEVTADALFLFGNGDGGGGPTEPMLEKLRRLRSLGGKNREVPLISMGGQMDDFFARLQERTDNGTKLPTWRGELYFELHRGTYTSHAPVKKGNRKNEYLLKDLEYAATLASILGDPSYEYPKEDLDWCWQQLLLCQFHDTLPGSAIRLAYDELDAFYAEIVKRCTALLEKAHRALSLGAPLASADLKQKGKLLALNPLRLGRREVVRVPLDGRGQLKAHCGQVAQGGKNGFMLVSAPADAGVGEVKGLFADLHPVQAEQKGKDEFTLRSGSVELTLRDGRITSLVDVALKRELIPEGQTGGLVIFRDTPNYWDAWDTEIFHLETGKQLKFESVSIAEVGPLRASLAAKIRLGETRFSCTISIDAVGASTHKDARSLIRFDCEVDWRQRHEFLKFELPVDIHAMDATYETQFGTVSRPTHRNTSWDQAKFEVCAHRFADLSEFGYGVAVVNDCKYGYGIEGQTIRLSLLRSPTAPDAEQDQGLHEFSFAIVPHVGTFAESDLPLIGQTFNSPLQLRYQSTADSLAPAVFNCAVAVDGAPNVLAETVKRGEDDGFASSSVAGGVKKGKKHIIVRLYEAYGGRAKATLRLNGLPIASATLANVLEDAVSPPLKLHHGRNVEGVEETTVELAFRGFEVKTVKLVVGEPSSKSSSEWVRIEKR